VSAAWLVAVAPGRGARGGRLYRVIWHLSTPDVGSLAWQWILRSAGSFDFEYVLAAIPVIVGRVGGDVSSLIARWAVRVPPILVAVQVSTMLTLFENVVGLHPAVLDSTGVSESDTDQLTLTGRDVYQPWLPLGADRGAGGAIAGGVLSRAAATTLSA